MIKTLTKVEMEGIYHNIMKAIYNKPTVNIILNGENLNTFSLKHGTRQECPLTTSIQCSIWNSSYRNHTRIKYIQILREEVKLYLYADDMTLYVENPKNSTQKTSRTKFSKVAGYKINIHKSVDFFTLTNSIKRKKFVYNPF